MPSRREQFYIGIAAAVAFAVIVAFLQVVVGLGAIGVVGVGGFVLLYGGFLLVARRFWAESPRAYAPNRPTVPVSTGLPIYTSTVPTVPEKERQFVNAAVTPRYL